MFKLFSRYRIIWLIAALCAHLASTAGAQSYYQYPFSYTTDGSAATIVDMAHVSGSVSIPSSLGGLPVRTIAARAFYGRAATSIAIPASVTTAEGNAFEGMSNLTSISVDSTNPNYSSSAGILYNKTKTTLVRRPSGLAGSPTFLTSVTRIGSYAFEGNPFSSVTMPDRITSVGSSAFRSCGSLTQVGFPANLTSLGYYCFKNCTALQSITLPPKLTEVPLECFYNCDALERIVIPPLVTTIGVDAFVSCQNLREVVIPAATITVPPNSFGDCPSLVSFEVHPDNTGNASADGVLYNKNMTQLKLYPAARPGAYVVPESVTAFQNLAFKGAKSLTGVRLPPGLLQIPIFAFEGCSELRWIGIPASVNSIGHYAFLGCSKLERAVFDGNAPTMGTSVFNNTAAGFAVYFYEDTAGFSLPVWQGYPAVSMGSRTASKEWLVAHELPHDSDLNQEISGLKLLMAYALDFDPWLSTAAELPRPMLVDGRLEMEFPAPRSDVAYRVETSEDLLRWSADGVTTVVLPGGTMRHASVGIGGNARFMRLVVER
jgi:BspA type Leucine rich repeat region (6 copies)